MIIPEVAPMLTCTQVNDGFLYELQISAQEGQDAITKIRIGPYFFKDAYRPTAGFMGIGSTGGPEGAFLMHKSTPRGWSRLWWQVDMDEEGQPAYLVAHGAMNPGTQGLFQFVSMFKPGGLRAGLQLFRGERTTECGVSGPDYHRFFEAGHH